MKMLTLPIPYNGVILALKGNFGHIPYTPITMIGLYDSIEIMALWLLVEISWLSRLL